MKQPTIENAVGRTRWMECPKGEYLFPGLAYIYPLNKLIIVRQKDAFHEIIGSKGVGYTIFNQAGQKVFVAVQDKQCKKFNLKIFNFYGNEVIQVKRPYKCCLHSVLVWAPPGNFVGSVEQIRSCISTFIVKNCAGKMVLKIKAHGLFHYIYDILHKEEEIGTVMNKWKLVAALNVNNFGISFPVELDVGYKAVLLGACFLIGCLKY